MYKIAPSILSADFSKLGEEISIIDKAGADYIHIDVMDGIFVPNISFGLPVIHGIRKITSKIFDVHLMIDEPIRFVDDFVKAGADIITVHAEACLHLNRTIQKIKESNIKAGVALNPATTLQELEYVIEDLDMVLIMSVNPGFGGQKFITSSLRKIDELRNLILKKGLSVDIQVDGGITTDNVLEVIQAGANIFVAGSSVFNGNPAQNIHAFKAVFDRA